MILKIPHEICLCVGPDAKHKVSGHLFEQIDYLYYFYFLKHRDVCILSDDAHLYIDKALEKYTFTEEEKNIIKSRVYSYPSGVRILSGENFIFVDGATFYSPRSKLIVQGRVFYFRCAVEQFQPHSVILQDNRLYGERPDGYHYVKKILFDKLKKPERSEDHKLLYLTSNCRHLSEEEFNNVIRKFNDDRKFLVISDKEEPFYNIPEVIFRKVPVDNLFEHFETYIYTPLHYSEMMDCSPRFIPECKYFGKEIIYDAPIYQGLNVRKYDTENRFESLFLREEDKLDEYIRYC